MPDSYWLGHKFPNPFNLKTVIQYHIPVKGLVLLKVFDVLGNEVAELLNANQEAGSYEAEFDGSGLASGVYFYRIEAGLFVQTKRMILLK
ncbi:MAG: T9SS type A sorting domain-containing protein [Ignavibacteria bacterium]|nr:T9SS type A sorting domain-containing protein [Ignavibacteria bacterium]